MTGNGPATPRFDLHAVGPGLARLTRVVLPQEWWQEYRGDAGRDLGRIAYLAVGRCSAHSAAPAFASHAGRRNTRCAVALGDCHLDRYCLASGMARCVVPEIPKPHDSSFRVLHSPRVATEQDARRTVARVRRIFKSRGGHYLVLYGRRLLLHQHCWRDIWDSRSLGDFDNRGNAQLSSGPTYPSLQTMSYGANRSQCEPLCAAVWRADVA